MRVKIGLHPILLEENVPSGPIRVEGQTVGECLRSFLQRFPSTKKKLFAGPGRLHPYIEIYVNDESAYPEELKRPVKEGDEISITCMMCGG